MYGILTLAFDRDIVRPTNETYFEEQLRTMIYTEDIHTNNVIEVPSFEVMLLPNEVHLE